MVPSFAAVAGSFWDCAAIDFRAWSFPVAVEAFYWEAWVAGVSELVNLLHDFHSSWGAKCVSEVSMHLVASDCSRPSSMDLVASSYQCSCYVECWDLMVTDSLHCRYCCWTMPMRDGLSCSSRLWCCCCYCWRAGVPMLVVKWMRDWRDRKIEFSHISRIELEQFSWY